MEVIACLVLDHGVGVLDGIGLFGVLSGEAFGGKSFEISL